MWNVIQNIRKWSNIVWLYCAHLEIMKKDSKSQPECWYYCQQPGWSIGAPLVLTTNGYQAREDFGTGLALWYLELVSTVLSSKINMNYKEILRQSSGNPAISPSPPFYKPLFQGSSWVLMSSVSLLHLACWVLHKLCTLFISLFPFFLIPNKNHSWHETQVITMCASRHILI